jgi:hypothetical protein
VCCIGVNHQRLKRLADIREKFKNSSKKAFCAKTSYIFRGENTKIIRLQFQLRQRPPSFGKTARQLQFNIQ